MRNRYGSLASWVYNLDKPVGRSFGDIEFFRNRLLRCRGTILEPAVGNGRLLIPLLEAGVDICGFDASDEMLKYCCVQCHRRGLLPRLENMRFQDFRYDLQFDAIIVPLGSFQLVDDFDEALGVLNRFHSHLKLQGRLIVDLDPIGDFFRNTIRVRHWTTDTGDLLSLQEYPPEVDYIAQRTVSSLHYEHWQNGHLTDTELDLFALRWWGVSEFTLALEQTGFADIVVSGDYQHGCPPKRDTRIITFEARRT